MLTIAMADDQLLVREAVQLKLEGQHRLIYAASNAASLLRFLRANPAPNHPQVVLMDIAMDGMDGIAATAAVKSLNGQIKVIMLTSFDDDEKVFEAIKAGADGYCIKQELDTRLLQSIDDVWAEGSYMSPAVARKAMFYLQKHYVPATQKADSPLSSREKEILRMVVDAETAVDIAKALSVSVATVKSHIYNVYKKLQVSNRLEAANLVRNKGWL